MFSFMQSVVDPDTNFYFPLDRKSKTIMFDLRLF